MKDYRFTTTSTMTSSVANQEENLISNELRFSEVNGSWWMSKDLSMTDSPKSLVIIRNGPTMLIFSIENDKNKITDDVNDRWLPVLTCLKIMLLIVYDTHRKEWNNYWAHSPVLLGLSSLSTRRGFVSFLFFFEVSGNGQGPDNTILL